MGSAAEPPGAVVTVRLGGGSPEAVEAVEAALRNHWQAFWGEVRDEVTGVRAVRWIAVDIASPLPDRPVDRTADAGTVEVRLVGTEDNDEAVLAVRSFLGEVFATVASSTEVNELKHTDILVTIDPDTPAPPPPHPA